MQEVNMQFSRILFTGSDNITSGIFALCKFDFLSFSCSAFLVNPKLLR